MNLSFPIPSSDLGAADLENEFIMCNLHLSQIQKKIERMAASGLDTTTVADEAFTGRMHFEAYKFTYYRRFCFFLFFGDTLQTLDWTDAAGDKLVRATELARSLLLEKSIKGAIKLVTALKLPILAE